MRGPNVQETIHFPARASGPQGQQAKTQNHFYPFPAGFHLIRSGHSSGEKGLCLSANAPTLCFNTGHTLLVLPLPLWLPLTPLFLPNCGSHCLPGSFYALSNSRHSPWVIWSTVASRAACVLRIPISCHHLPLQTCRPNCSPGLTAYLIDISKSGSK